MALSQPCEAGQAALSLCQWTNFSDIPWGLCACGVIKQASFLCAPLYGFIFTEEGDFYILSILLPIQEILIIPFKNPMRLIFFTDIKGVTNKIQ